MNEFMDRAQYWIHLIHTLQTSGTAFSKWINGPRLTVCRTFLSCVSKSLSLQSLKLGFQNWNALTL